MLTPQVGCICRSQHVQRDLALHLNREGDKQPSRMICGACVGMGWSLVSGLATWATPTTLNDRYPPFRQ